MINKIVAYINNKHIDLISSYLTNPFPVELKPMIQNYAWGETGEAAYIPKLLGVPAQNKEWAELWIGIHEKAPSIVTLDKTDLSLAKLYKIPWLTKILAAKEMLSIQVHPNKKQALLGYEKEIEQKLPADKRCYLDNNAKPELAIPLTDFWLMSDFLPKAKLLKKFGAYAELVNAFAFELNALKKAKNAAYITEAKKNLYSKIMTLTQPEINQILKPIAEKIIKENLQKPYTKSNIEYWFLKALEKYAPNGNYDIGLFSFFLMNLVHLVPFGSKNNYKSADAIHLKPGQGLFTAAGSPHFYLEGVCIEQMANSDNVVRAGLTPKYKNINELLKIIDYNEKKLAITQPKITKKEGNLEAHYLNHSNVFDGTYYQTQKGTVESFTATDKLKAVIILKGDLTIRSDGKDYDFKTGQTFIVPPNKSYEIRANSDLTLFEAS